MAEKKSIVDYVLLDPAERLRVDILELPTKFKTSIIRAPVPWRNNYLVSKQFCRHNLFITNQIIMRIRTTWEKRYRTLRFVNTGHLRSKSNNPLSPDEMQEKVEEQCMVAKDILLHVRKQGSF